MRELHVVAVSEDGRHVVLATRKGALKGEFRVPLDERLSAAVRGDLPRPGEDAPAVVTPKEIQSRLRAGESPEEIAASAGVPVSKIDRYAGPVLSERERVISQARAGFVTRSRLGESALPLGEAVDRHLAETTGVRLETVHWSARREETGTWLVELSYVSQARRRGAVWRYDGSRREVTAVDSLAAALAHVDGSARRARATEAEPLAAPAARRSAPARKAQPVKTRSVKVKPAKAPAARKVAASPPARAAAPVPRAAAPAKAAQTAATRAAAATAARATTARAAAQERTAKAAAADAARAAAQAKEAAQAQARAAEARTAKAAADKAAKAAADKAAKAAAAKAAKDKAASDKAAREQAAREKTAAAKAAQQAARKRAAAEKAAAEKAAAEKAAAEQAEAARLAAEQAAAEQEAPTAPPTLRVVGADDAPVPARRGAKQPPAAARTAPARVAGQRASVPGWADVLLSTAPVARPEREPDAD